MPVKKMSGTFRLKQFVIHDVRNLSQFKFFVIDLKALKDTENEIIEAIMAFAAMYDARIILFAEGIDAGGQLISKLIDIGVYNIITSAGFEEIKEEMLKCISPEGKDMRSAIRSRYFEKEEIKRNKKGTFAFLCKDIKIAVLGAGQRVGTTTTAFNMANFLVDMGADVAYVEANTNGHLCTLLDYYKDMKVNERYVEYRGVKYYFRGNFPDENNFTVIDFGVIEQCRLQALKQCNLVIVCGTTKPYEIDKVKVVIEMLQGMPINIVLAHTTKKERQDIAGMLAGDYVNVYFSEYSPDLFDGKVNAKIFTEIIKEYINETHDYKQ